MTAQVLQGQFWAGLSWLGRHARAVLLIGLVGMPFLPVSPETVRPALPLVVVLVTALGFLRLQPGREGLTRLLRPRALAGAALFLLAGQAVLALIVGAAGLWLGASVALLLPLVTFCAAPPLSSAPNVTILLGYDFTTTLRLTLLGTFLAPVLMPLSLALSGVQVDVETGMIALKILGMLGSGIALGVVLQAWLGAERIAAGADSLNAASALAMLLFLVPVTGGSAMLVRADPIGALALLALAFLLNIGGSLLVRAIAARRAARGSGRDSATASALGLVFGNRNTSLVMAVLPFDPHLTLFVAAMQVPIYAGPFLFSLFERRQPQCPVSSAS